MTETVVLTPSQRVRRVAHRLGVVLAVPLLLIGLWNAGVGVMKWLEIPPASERLQEGPWTKYQPAADVAAGGASLEELKAAALDRAEARRAEAESRAAFEIATFTLIGGVLTYIAIVALGWVVAGAFRH